MKRAEHDIADETLQSIMNSIPSPSLLMNLVQISRQHFGWYTKHIPSKPLPLEMNFPTHFTIHENFEPQIINPYIIHYHHKISDGNIMHCTYNNVNLILDKINHVIHSPDIK